MALVTNPHDRPEDIVADEVMQAPLILSALLALALLAVAAFWVIGTEDQRLAGDAATFAYISDGAKDTGAVIQGRSHLAGR